GARRDRARSCHLPRVRRGDARDDHRRQPLGSLRRRIHDPLAGARTHRASGYSRMKPSSPLRALVIDDEPPIRKLLRMGLGTHGYQVLEAADGKEALDLLEQKPDIVILDLGLPDMRGLDLLQQIRAQNERVPVVVLSSRDDERTKVEALDLGADDYV